MHKITDLTDIDKISNELRILENEADVFYDVQATVIYNELRIKNGKQIKVMSVYNDNKLIAAVYINIFGNRNNKYTAYDSIIYLKSYSPFLEKFIDDHFYRQNIAIRVNVLQDLTFHKLHKIKNNAKTVLIPVKENEDEQKKMLVKGRPHDVTKALKNNLKFKVLNTYDEYMKMLDILNKLENAKNFVGEKIPIKLYYDILEPAGYAVAYGIFKEDELIAVTLVLKTKNYCRAQIIAEDPKYMDTGAQSLLIWNILNHLRLENIRYLDLAGFPDHNSYMHGIGLFEKSFGGIVLDLKNYNENTISRLKNNIIKSPTFQKIYKFYKMLV
jgi:hypothetical protein